MIEKTYKLWNKTARSLGPQSVTLLTVGESFNLPTQGLSRKWV